MIKSLGNAFKKMSQRALWRGDRGQSQMLESHGMAGMRSNLLRDTPTYKKETIGLNKNTFNISKTSKNNTSKNTTNNDFKNINKNPQNNNNQNKSLGSSILDSF